ncbi:hypothetical protein EYF80_026417 [Liparis tanakae]|uniref:Uncharacterized protein n=1 Tax=Liparis tanakae TaxID=230148 RepID=A0A4Z2HDI3_9TELE|nr:hypothetical protein EYF80_026417 [Liparis tanakae]
MTSCTPLPPPPPPLPVGAKTKRLHREPAHLHTGPEQHQPVCRCGVAYLEKGLLLLLEPSTVVPALPS